MARCCSPATGPTGCATRKVWCIRQRPRCGADAHFVRLFRSLYLFFRAQSSPSLPASQCDRLRSAEPSRSRQRPEQNMITRRDALILSTALVGTALVGPALGTLM